jgi:hypothetical protein
VFREKIANGPDFDPLAKTICNTATSLWQIVKKRRGPRGEPPDETRDCNCDGTCDEAPIRRTKTVRMVMTKLSLNKVF